MNMNTGEESGDFPASRFSGMVASPAISDFAKTMAPRAKRASSRRMNLDADKKKNGLAQLVLTVVKLLHELLEKQAIRRITGEALQMKRLSVSVSP